MPAFLGPLIAGGLSLIGGLAANSANKKRAAEQMAFQERMSSTAYQRATEDMRLSGINPMLAYQQGGASSPGGAQAQMQDVLSPAVSSAQHARMLDQELRFAKETFDDRKKAKREEARRAFWDTESAMKQSEILDTEKQMRERENIASAAELYQVLNKARVEKSFLGKAAPWVDKIRETIFPFLMLGKQGGPIGQPFGRGSSIRGRY